MSAHAVIAGPAEGDTSLRAVPWRRMAWVIWRQHRLGLAGVAALLGGLTLYVWLAGLGLHHAYAAAIACHPAASAACAEALQSFNAGGHALRGGYALQAVPALIGAFLGAPLLARELETGTFRYAWTQGFGRQRWTAAKLVGLAVVVTAAAGAFSVLVSWYYAPYLAPRNQGLTLTEWSPLAPGLFDLRGFAFAAWTLVAFAIGGLAGMLVRRVVPAIVATLTAYIGLALAAAHVVRPHYLTPLVTSRLSLPDSEWILSQEWLTKGHRAVSQSALGSFLQQHRPQLAGKGGVPQSMDVWQYLVHQGFTRSITYQPADRFWALQWIESGWLLALSVLLIAATVWLVRRRAT